MKKGGGHRNAPPLNWRCLSKCTTCFTGCHMLPTQHPYTLSRGRQADHFNALLPEGRCLHAQGRLHLLRIVYSASGQSVRWRAVRRFSTPHHLRWIVWTDLRVGRRLKVTARIGDARQLSIGEIHGCSVKGGRRFSNSGSDGKELACRDGLRRMSASSPLFCVGMPNLQLLQWHHTFVYPRRNHE